MVNNTSNISCSIELSGAINPLILCTYIKVPSSDFEKTLQVSFVFRIVCILLLIPRN